MENWKDNIHFILVESKEAGNIGASARAMKNMGFKNLELINPALQKAFNEDLYLKTVKYSCLFAIFHDYVDKRVKKYII